MRTTDLRLLPAAIGGWLLILMSQYVSGLVLLLFAAGSILAVGGAWMNKGGRHLQANVGRINGMVILLLISMVALAGPAWLKASQVSASTLGQQTAGQVVAKIVTETKQNERTAFAKAQIISVLDRPISMPALIFEKRLHAHPGQTIRAKCTWKRHSGLGRIMLACSRSKIIRRADPWTHWANSRRQKLHSRLGNSAAGALVCAMALGDNRYLSPTSSANMKRAALAHLAVVSGTHVAIVISTFWGLLAFLKRRLRLLSAATVLVGFVILVGPMPTVARASAMGMIALAGMALGRPGSATGALALVTMGLLITHPTYAADIGFALSVSATFAVLTLSERIEAPLRSILPKGIAKAVSTSIAAQSFSGPLLLLLSPGTSLYAPIANLLAAPAIAPATLLGLLGALLPRPVAQPILALAKLAAWWIATVANKISALPGAVLPWQGGPAGAVALAFSVLCILFAVHRHFAAIDGGGSWHG